MKPDPRLAQIHHELAMKAEALRYWLDENYSYTTVSIFFLCGVLATLIEEGWPEDKPPVYSDLTDAIERLALEVGPMIAAVELEGRSSVVKEQVSCERQRKTRKHTVN